MTTDVRKPLPELAIGQIAAIIAAGTSVLLVRTPRGLRACAALCPHQNRTLSGAIVRSQTIICPWHGAVFSLEDGTSGSRAIAKALSIYPCREDGSDVIIEMPDP